MEVPSPKTVPGVDTEYRRIKTKIPPEESIPILQDLYRYEPRSMRGQPPVIWDRAEGFQVWDKFGNKWLDWSSGVLVANSGHSNEKIKLSIHKQLDQNLLHNYCFPSEIRAKLVKELSQISPAGLEKVFLLTTGSETTENALKLARTYGQKIGGKKKIGIVSFEGAFHGRTLGAQMIGGVPHLKEWIPHQDPNIYQIPYPGDFRLEDISFATFQESLREQDVDPDTISAVITETYQGGRAAFMPRDYVQQLSKWCQKHGALLIFDEVQAGFGRTGTMFGFEHYNVVPDIMCCGKGISSSLPISCVISRSEIMDLYEPGSMTSTHTGNPVSVAASLANLEYIQDNSLVGNARQVGAILNRRLRELEEKYPKRIGKVNGRGLVAGIHIVQPNNLNPDNTLAVEIVNRAVEKGLLLFSPVGPGGGTVKISPPLTITEEAIQAGLSVIGEVFEEILESSSK